MNTQISFSMSKEDEKLFIDYVRQSGCKVIKRTLFEGEKCNVIYPCDGLYSQGYFICIDGFDYLHSYSVTVIDGRGVNAISPLDDTMHAKPLIDFSRGIIEKNGIGHLSADSQNMLPEDRKAIVKKFKELRDWIIDNAKTVLDLGRNGKVYLLEGASEIYKQNGNSFVNG